MDRGQPGRRHIPLQGGDESDEIRSNTCQELAKQKEEKRSSQWLLSGWVSLSCQGAAAAVLLLLSSPAAAFTVTQREPPVCRIYSGAARDPEQSRGARSEAERGGRGRGEEGHWTTVQSRLSAPGHKAERLTPLLRGIVDFCHFKSSSWVTGVGLCLCKPHFYNL